MAQPGIYGIALNGKNNTQRIVDTDAGQYDSDTKYDRAVGPMQFIPSTWSVVGVDGDNDGKRNPQDIDDAALASAVYLCSGEDDLSTDQGQRASVYRYNHSNDYVDLVISIMQAYLAGDFTSVSNGTTSAGVFLPSTARPTSGSARTVGSRGGKDSGKGSGRDQGRDSGGDSGGDSGKDRGSAVAQGPSTSTSTSAKPTPTATAPAPTSTAPTPTQAPAPTQTTKAVPPSDPTTLPTTKLPASSNPVPTVPVPTATPTVPAPLTTLQAQDICDDVYSPLTQAAAYTECVARVLTGGAP